MLSRLADAMFWMARYLERAESTVRLLLAQDVQSLGATTAASVHTRWDRVLYMSGQKQVAPGAAADRDAVCRSMIWAQDNPNSVVSCVNRARENARALQERLPSEIWEAHNELYWDLREIMQRSESIDNLQEFCAFVKRHAFQVAGAVQSCLPRREEYHFYQMGTYLERAEQMSRMLELLVRVSAQDTRASVLTDIPYWTHVLQSAGAHESFLKSGLMRITPTRVIAYLMLDDAYPRSLLYCVGCVQESVRQTTGAQRVGEKYPLLDTVTGWAEGMRAHSAESLMQRDLPGTLSEFQEQCQQVGNLIFQHVFHQEQEVDQVGRDVPRHSYHDIQLRVGGP